MSKGPSKHLSWKELACKDGTPYPNKWRSSRAVTLSIAFEGIRFVCGEKPITILSAYRTPEHNRKIGGAKNSQHMEGRALDLRPPKGMPIQKFYEIIKAVAEDLGINGVGRYKTFIHIDIRPSNKLVIWSGTGAKDTINT